MIKDFVKDLFRVTARVGKLAYATLLGVTALIFLFFFSNVFIFLCSHVSESLLELLDYLFEARNHG